MSSNVSARKSLIALMIAVISSGLIMVFLNQNFIYTKQLFYRSLDGQMEIGQIDDMLNQANRLKAPGYFLYVIITLCKLFIIALILQTALLLSGVKTAYQRILRSVTLAELVLLIPVVVKFIWFYYIQTDYTYEEVNRFSALSLVQLTEVDTTSIWIYPLQVVNLFELLYILLLAVGLRRVTHDFDGALRIVVVAYLPVLVIWITVLMFMRLMFS